MVGVETKRRVVRNWIESEVDGVGETTAERFVEKHISEDTDTVAELVTGGQHDQNLSEDIPYAPSKTGNYIRQTLFPREGEGEDPLAEITDVNLIYARISIDHLTIKVDPEDPSELNMDRWFLFYASEEGETIHTAHNI